MSKSPTKCEGGDFPCKEPLLREQAKGLVYAMARLRSELNLRRFDGGTESGLHGSPGLVPPFLQSFLFPLHLHGDLSSKKVAPPPGLDPRRLLVQQFGLLDEGQLFPAVASLQKEHLESSKFKQRPSSPRFLLSSVY